MVKISPVRTTCPYCGTGCGLLVTPDGQGGIASLRGDPDHPANHGLLCGKGMALAETLSMDGRLKQPLIHGRQSSWEEALQQVADGFLSTVQKYGAEAVAFYVSGQLLTEDYYLANKLLKGFLGSANIDSNSRLCMASAVVGHKRAFGADFVPCSYRDLEEADLTVIVGSNTAWCHPVLLRRIRMARQKGAHKRLVVIDPRRTATAEEADLHLPLRAGSDLSLWLGLLHDLQRHQALNQEYLQQHVAVDPEAFALAAAHAGTLAQVAEQCGLSEESIAAFYALFRATPRTVTLFSQGINQSEQGSDQVSAIINVHLATGRLGQPGMGPFSLTGQPNAMGGREVGALATHLTAHLEIERSEDRRLLAEYWQTTRLPKAPGRKAVDLFQDLADGVIKAIWIMGTNPLVSLPNPELAQKGLQRCPLVVISDPVAHTDSSRFAHIQLPAQTWGEKEGTVSNSERCISRQRAFLPPYGDARADWQIIQEVAQRMGFADSFCYTGPAEIFREYAQLTALENHGQRLLDLTALADLAEEEYAQMSPCTWPANESLHPHHSLPRWPLPEGRARLWAVAPRPRSPQADGKYPFLLNTGRVRDHWHTLTRTGVSPRLSKHSSAPFVEIHPQDASQLAIHSGQLLRVANQQGSMLAKARISEGQRRGHLFLPMHWSHSFASQGKCNHLLSSWHDPVSGQPGFKFAYAEVTPVTEYWQGMLLTRQPLQWHNGPFYWSRQALEGSLWMYGLIGLEPLASWSEQSRHWLQPLCKEQESSWIDFVDSGRQHYGCALLQEGALLATLHIGETLPDPQRCSALFAERELSAQQRLALFSGGSAVLVAESRTICACSGVTEEQIRKAVASDPSLSVAQIGATLKAGSFCGSCQGEIKQILAQSQGRRCA
ncbi:nitrate reductase [Candidatus Magnetaquicoccus inordinatus]|uniref:nitrate reductase n=1 Tax=Candidatus Magnetaquicoccus inordinatus TaxID=2496818 RepID=UPI00102BBE8D|nr:nitrate reductase [Candidatus Magnetaquicoccus inordinatus]